MDSAQFVENLLQALIAGILTGIIYGLMCAGLSMIFGIMRVINFAQGEFMMLGMYAAYYLFTLLSPDSVAGSIAAPLFAAVLAGPLVFVLGCLVHAVLVSRVTGMQGRTLAAQGHHAQLVLTLGLALLLQNGGLLLFGSTPVSIPTPLSYSAWELGPLYGDRISVFVNQNQVATALVAIAVWVALSALMARSRFGRGLRAAADHQEAALYAGINVSAAYRYAFGIGVGVTAIGGGLLASSYPFQPYVGLEYVIIMYAGVVLGGLGSTSGAFAGGIAIGIIQQVSGLFLPAQLQNAAIFVGFLAIITLRPNGLFGRAARAA